jgi:UDP-N-acetylmuramyl pentapeptide phosphotransferase/UDP-N-acetylglucosamine-1-phosphate transferase
VTPALLAGVVTAVSCPLVIRALVRAGRLDHPNLRSSHSQPTPRGGGLAILAGLLAVAVWAAATGSWSSGTWVAVGGCAALGCVGLLDDVRGLPPAPRFAAQVTVGVVVGAALGGPVGALLGTVVVPAAVNMVNFMDGINGLCGGHAALWGAAAVFAAGVFGGASSAGADSLGALGALSLGGALGFLPFNVPRARLFLGDVGSYLLGGIAGIGLLVAATKVLDGTASSWPLIGLVCAPYLLFAVDTSTTIARRLRAGEPVFQAHRSHVYQQLVNDGGLPHWAVSLAMVAASFAVTLSCVLGWPATVAVTGLSVTGYLLSPRWGRAGRPA